MPTKSRIKTVHMQVHPDFFNKLEQERKKFERKTGINLRQSQMTKILSQMKLDFSVGKDLHNVLNKRPKRGRN